MAAEPEASTAIIASSAPVAGDDFTSGICGQTLLRLCSRGSAIIAELFRLAEHLPAPVLGPELCTAQDAPLAVRYAPVLFELRYLNEPDLYESKIRADTALGDLDEEFQQLYESVIARFYKLFESIWKYHSDLANFLGQLEEGFYIQSTVESLFLDREGRQLLCEAVGLKGTMLLLMDRRIPGLARERLIVAQHRYHGEAETPEIENVARLCRDAGYLAPVFAERRALAASAAANTNPRSKAAVAAFEEAMRRSRPKQYPLALFSRVPVPESVMAQLLGCLRSEDIYMKTRVFPRPDHRSTALAQQAALAYVCLNFAPGVLLEERSMMRELTDKHFADNWVIPICLGFTVDIAVEWADYPAARQALETDTLREANVRDNASKMVGLFKAADERLGQLLAEGALTEASVSAGVGKTLDVLRAANVSLRWILLHRATAHPGFREKLRSVTPDEPMLLDFLLRTAEFEFRLKGLLNDIVDARATKWAEVQAQVTESLQQLAALFAGDIPSSIDPDEGLATWFRKVAGEVLVLDMAQATEAGRRIHRVVEALTSVEAFEAVDSQPLVRDFLADTRSRLASMVKLLNVEEHVVQHTAMISDLAYAWGPVLEAMLPFLHERIRSSPSALSAMRALFHKLTSILDIPVARVAQAKSPDLPSVAELYSGQLVAFVRRVMEAVPIVVFSLLSRVARIRAEQLKALPVRFEAGQLKDLSCLDARYELAKRTHQIATFTEGVRRQEKTFMGVIEVDPSKILFDGIRKQLVEQVCRALDIGMRFDLRMPDGTRAGRDRDPRKSVITALESIKLTLTSLHDSVEYIQDFVGIKGLRMWQEETTRLFAFYTEQEANRFVKRQVAPESSQFQDAAAPIPLHRSEDGQSIAFMGRALAALLTLSSPGDTVFAPAGDGWFTPGGEEFAGLRLFTMLRESLGVAGVTGLDRLLGFLLVRRLDVTLRRFQAEMRGGAEPTIRTFRSDLLPTTSLFSRGTKVHDAVCTKLSSKLDASAEDLIGIGHAQLLRRSLSHQLREACSLESGTAFSAVSSLNDALIRDVRLHYHKAETHPFPKASNPLLPLMSDMLEHMGLTNPMLKIYVTRDSMPLLDLWLALVVLNVAPRMTYDSDFQTLVKVPGNKRDTLGLDGTPFCAGLATVLKQLHPRVFRSVMAFLGQYVRTSIHTVLASKTPGVKPPGVVNTVIVMETVCDMLGIDQSVLHTFIPEFVHAAVTS
jgi:WASH complex subunit strumpellin